MAEEHSIPLCHIPLIDSVENTIIEELPNNRYCNICSKYFKHSYAVMQHKIDKHNYTGTPTHDDENDTFTFPSLKSKEEFSCDICYKKFEKLAALQQHRRSTKKHLKLYSQLYPQPLGDNASLEEQNSASYSQSPGENTSLEEQNELCEICNKSFQSEKSLQDHLRDSKKHRKLRRKMNAKISKLETQTSKDEEKPLLVNIETCEVCNKRFLCKQFYHAHRLSFAHKIKAMEKTIVHQMEETNTFALDNVKQICKEINRESLLKLIEEESEEIDSILDAFDKKLHENLKSTETQIAPTGSKGKIACSMCQRSWRGSNKGVLNFAKHYFMHCKKKNEKHTYSQDLSEKN